MRTRPRDARLGSGRQAEGGVEQDEKEHTSKGSIDLKMNSRLKQNKDRIITDSHACLNLNYSALAN